VIRDDFRARFLTHHSSLLKSVKIIGWFKSWNCLNQFIATYYTTQEVQEFHKYTNPAAMRQHLVDGNTGASLIRRQTVSHFWRAFISSWAARTPRAANASKMRCQVLSSSSIGQSTNISPGSLPGVVVCWRSGLLLLMVTFLNKGILIYLLHPCNAQ
jgi:hypothetical protein